MLMHSTPQTTSRARWIRRLLEPFINIMDARARDRQWFSAMAFLSGSKRLQSREDASALLCGDGIEIGALHNPLRVDPSKARVRYVDRQPKATLIGVYAEIPADQIIEPDILAEA